MSARPREYRDGRVRLVGCSPGCLVVSLVVSVLLTIFLNLVVRLLRGGFRLRAAGHNVALFNNERGGRPCRPLQ
jgi:hypothetical protein